jgi:predicted RND superfamily exporter protein
MFTIIGIIAGFILSCFILISYLEYKSEVNEQKELKENLDKFETRTGALSNDRVDERTTIPKKNGK